MLRRLTHHDRISMRIAGLSGQTAAFVEPAAFNPRGRNWRAHAHALTMKQRGLFGSW
jgi:hypothetical protein